MKKREQPRCKKCGKPIIFIRTAQGAYMPAEQTAIYAVEDRCGDLSIITETGRIIRVREARPEDREKIIGNVLHWIGCEGAEEIKREYGARRKIEAAREAAKKQAERREEKQQKPKTAEQLKLFGG